MTDVLVFIALAVIVPLLVSELGDWCPWLAARLVCWVANRVGDPDASERYREEFLANLNAVPGKLSRLISALGYIVNLPKLRREVRRRAQEEAVEEELRFDLTFTRADDGDGELQYGSRPLAYGQHDVTAVLVAHDGERWVGRVIDALAAQERPIQRIVAVDTSSRDGTVDILNQSLGEGRVITRPRDAGFGQAVAFGVGAVFGGLPPPAVRGDPDEPVEWIWILHDDCEPATDALHYLLALADENPDVGVVGPKILGWYKPREILEAGLTIAPSGHRVTGLDRGEEDQGQHDGQRRVLAVSSAGMLIRRDVWEALRGFDQQVPFMRDDLDFCWRVSQAGWQVVVNSDAVVYHVEAAAKGKRQFATRVGRPHYLDRAHALYVLLVNMRLARVPLALVRLGLSTLARALGYLVTNRTQDAIDEVLALGSVFGRFPRLIRARIARHRRHSVKAGELRRLFPPWGSSRWLYEARAAYLYYVRFRRLRVLFARSSPR
jgi:GT2 family glycosyltransferase